MSEIPKVMQNKNPLLFPRESKSIIIGLQSHMQNEVSHLYCLLGLEFTGPLTMGKSYLASVYSLGKRGAWPRPGL